jgi:5-formyltetrahydrofolate cyclo-ligase
MTGKNPRSWQTWRREERQRLLDARSALPLATRHTLALGVQNNLDRVLDEHPCSVLGIYWPIKHEVNLLLWAAAFS